MTLEEKNIELNDKFNNMLNDAKTKGDSNIFSNPKFDELFLNELSNIYFKTADLDIKIEESFDKKSVSIVSYAPLINSAKKELDGKNKNFYKTTFYIKNNNLFVEYDQGTLINKEELEKADMKSNVFYECKLETNYSMRCFNEFGVEYSNNLYNDSYLIDEDKYDDINLREIVQSSFYKPVFSEYKLAKAPIHILNANVKNIYRKAGEYGVIHVNYSKCTKNGYEGINCSLYSVHTMFPELLRGAIRIAKTVESTDEKNMNFVFEVDNNYAENVSMCIKKANESFKNEIMNNKNKIDEKIYNNLLENV